MNLPCQIGTELFPFYLSAGSPTWALPRPRSFTTSTTITTCPALCSCSTSAPSPTWTADSTPPQTASRRTVPRRRRREDGRRPQMVRNWRLSLHIHKSCTGPGNNTCTWFGEVGSCCCLPLLPEIACNILATTYKYYFRTQYI